MTALKMKKANDTRVMLSQRKRKIFLDTLAKTGKVNDSAHAAGFTTTVFLHKLRKEDEDFAEAWDLAVHAAADMLEAEAHRRAVDGTMEPVFYKGEVVGHKVNYSDALLLAMLRAARPDKYNRGGGDTNVNVKFGIAVLPMTNQNEDDWEKGAIEMHKGQEFFEIKDFEALDGAKPSSVQRGD